MRAAQTQGELCKRSRLAARELVDNPPLRSQPMHAASGSVDSPTLSHPFPKLARVFVIGTVDEIHEAVVLTNGYGSVEPNANPSCHLVFHTLSIYKPLFV